MQKVFLLCVVFVFVGCGGDGQGGAEGKSLDKPVDPLVSEKSLLPSESVNDPRTVEHVTNIDFSDLDESFLFSGVIDDSWDVEHVEGIDAINIYAPQSESETSFEQSQIFVRYFEATEFLTLDTVEIFSQTPGQIAGRASVTYEIEKKPGVADFTSQPTWRNDRHFVTDVRYRQESPSVFYVFARRPSLDEEVFEDFMRSLSFDIDSEGEFTEPLTDSTPRITKKPFGVYVTPETSLIEGERFNGYHSGTDFEVSAAELERDVDVFAICDGRITFVGKIGGYGGVIRQTCQRSGEDLYVVYGHVSLVDALVDVGQDVSAGTTLTELGDDRSIETDGERKHLHLGISIAPDVRGYVGEESGLSTWIDYESFDKINK